MKIHILGVPMDLGADLRGVDMGPSAIRIAGVAERLAKPGHFVAGLGDGSGRHASVAGRATPRLKYVDSIRGACRELAGAVERALLGRTKPLVLGGDHS